MVELRAYQTDAIERVRARREEGIRRILLCAPTGAGKTIIAASIMERVAARGGRLLFLAHRRELINQTYNKLLEAGVPASQIGVLMARDPRTFPERPVQVASIDTLRHRERPAATVLLVDEAHRSLAQSYLDAIDHYFGEGTTIIGLTATPWRADGGGLGAIYEALEVVATPSQLITMGFLAAPRVFSCATPDLRGVRVRGGDYVESDLATAMSQTGLIGDILEHWRKHAAGMRTVAFACDIAHSRSIVDRFFEAGIPAEHLDGATPNDERDAILSRLERGETLVVSNCNVLCEGWDQPSVKAAILARPTKSTTLHIQQCGRILRPWSDTVPIILDHAGNCLAHGLPQDDRVYELTIKSAKPKAAPVKKCPSCGAVVPIGSTECPECGHEFALTEDEKQTLLEQDGELRELDANHTQQMRDCWAAIVVEWRRRSETRMERGDRAIKPFWCRHRFRELTGFANPPPGCDLPHELATAEEKRERLRELHRFAAEKGYKPGWVLHRYREQYGELPLRRVR